MPDPGGKALTQPSWNSKPEVPVAALQDSKMPKMTEVVIPSDKKYFILFNPESVHSALYGMSFS